MEVSKSLRITEALKMMVPIGTIMAYGGDVEKSEIIDKLKQQGWLFCDGTEYKRTDYPELYDVIQDYFGHGNNSTTFNVPDLCGQFLRGVDHGKKKDPNALERMPSAPGGNESDAVGSSQKDEFKKHRHKFLPKMICDGTKGRYGGGEWGDFVDETGEEGGLETRPTNIYVNWIIKATHEIGN